MSFNEKDLLKAINSYDLSTIKYFVKTLHGPDIWIKGKKKFLLLEVVLYKNALPIIEFLLSEKCNVNVQNGKGETALHLACSFANGDIVRCLLKAGANINIKNAHGETAFHYACRMPTHYQEDLSGYQFHCEKPVLNIEIVQLLISEGVDVNAQDKKGNTALFNACRENLYSLVEMLIKSGADLNISNIYGHSLYYEPCIMINYYKWEPLLELLINSGAPLDFEQVIFLCLHTSTKFVQKMLKTVPLRMEETASLLVFALQCKNETLFEYLVKCGIANPNFADNHSEKAKPLIIECVINNLHSALYCLLNISYDINVKDYDGQTALHHSVIENDEVSLKLLIEHNCDINYTDNLNRTPLHFAVTLKRFKLAKILLANGSDVNIQDNKGRTCLYYITCPVLYNRTQFQRLELIKLFFNSGYQINKFGFTDFIFSNLINEWNFSPPSYTAEILLLFLQAGYDISRDNSVQPIEKFFLRLQKKTRENHCNLFNLIIYLSQKPSSLRELSARVIRETVRCKDISKLLLPESLKRHIKFENILIT